ncbi:unnamed protein product [Brassica oleracea var. botrytis]
MTVYAWFARKDKSQCVVLTDLRDLWEIRVFLVF